jgi:hypothetical protein
VDAGSGQYIFDPTLLSQHHDANFSAFERSLAAGVACIVVDNTNIQVGFGKGGRGGWLFPKQR